MTVSRRQLLTGGAAGVGLAVAGSLPAFAGGTGPSSRDGDRSLPTGGCCSSTSRCRGSTLAITGPWEKYLGGR